jgi:exodeoxyribonuclease V alpha subunit
MDTNMPTPNQLTALEKLLAEARAKLAATILPQIATSVLEIRMNELHKKAENDLGSLERKEMEQDADIEAEEDDIDLHIPTPESVATLNAFQKAQSEIVYNKGQTEALTRAENGESFCLIGKAGTGKTTATREIVRLGMTTGRIGPLSQSTKWLSTGTPGVCVVSFTNRAVANIAKGMSKDLQRNCLTVHKLIEFEPEFYEVKLADGNWVNRMRFMPKRNRHNPLPSSLKCIIFEESSMISVELYKMLLDALPHSCQMIFLGDLQQLPPVYGSAILGFKLLELPVVELTEIYRQAADSPIISLAWRIASGDPIGPKEFEGLNKKKGLMIRPWKKKLAADDALHISDLLFQDLMKNGLYTPEEDMIMIPFNKAFGTIEFNKNIAQYLGKQRNAEVFEIIAGFNKYYYAVGDKVLVEKQEAIIQEIVTNGRFVSSVIPLAPSVRLNRWGIYDMENSNVHISDEDEQAKAMDDVENFLLATMSSGSADEEVRQQASHIIKCRVIGTDEVIDISTSGEYSATTFSYALTVHKCQGSEWKKCFLILHRSHSVMLSRELLYTAVTRARESLYIICEPESLVKGVNTQRIRGNTIKEKAEYFKGKLEDMKGGW